MNKLILISMFLVGIGCNLSNDTKESIDNEHGTTFNCDSIWRKLIFTSNYSPLGEVYDFDSLTYRILGEDITDSTILIKMVSIGKDSEFPVGWLELRIHDKTLSDITLEDSIVTLKVDNALLEAVFTNCSTTKQLFKD